MTVSGSAFIALKDGVAGFFSEPPRSPRHNSFGMILETQRFSQRVSKRADHKLRIAARSVRQGRLGGALMLLNEVEDDLRSHERELIDSFSSR
ncbi:MAG: hypothetical protein M3391_07315 [Actinomycetota bacterium]|nr:hypothetical protein [Actinomycetota bacterium]